MIGGSSVGIVGASVGASVGGVVGASSGHSLGSATQIGGWGNITAVYGPYDDPALNPDLDRSVIVQTVYRSTDSEEFNRVIQVLKEYTRQVNLEEIPYSPGGPNSNSFAHGAIKKLGKDIEPGKTVPGWNDDLDDWHKRHLPAPYAPYQGPMGG